MKNNFTIDEVRKFWDGVGDEYDEINGRIGKTHHQRFREASKYLNSLAGQKILNVWSRTGEAIPYIRQICPDAEIFNLEVSNEFIKKAKEKFPKENFEETNLDKFPFEKDSFDYVISLETLEHAPLPLEFLKECRRTLKPEGILIMSLPPKTAELPLRLYELFFKNHGEGPHNFLSSKTVKKMIRDAGMELITHRGTLLVPAGPEWLKNFGEKIIEKCQNTPLKEMGIRQFYISKKTNE
ncbi:MAG: methyltransferase domain-containing protein [Candidatus Pacebacteria bacterium]|nr:methyltransferase domain-containing protein [Candidatus Paceibacterota bacterium]